MIGHFIEVWLLLALTFTIGCALGALGYELIAHSGAARFQRSVVDRIGDVVDGVKQRLGINPAWREYQTVPDASFASPDEPEPTFERAAEAAPPPPVSEDAPPEALTPGPAFEAEQADDDVAVEVEAAPIERPDPAPADEPAPAPADDGDSGPTPMRPSSLLEPRNGVPDNLQRIRGIGKKNEAILNGFGIFHFGQIASWTPAEVAWVAERIAFPERIENDDWIGQAIILAAGGDTGVTKSADRRRQKRSIAVEPDPSDATDDDQDEVVFIDEQPPKPVADTDTNE